MNYSKLINWLFCALLLVSCGSSAPQRPPSTSVVPTLDALDSVGEGAGSNAGPGGVRWNPFLRRHKPDSNQDVVYDYERGVYVTRPDDGVYRKAATHTQVKVYYGTDRRLNSTRGRARYGTDFGPFDYGTATVSVPKDHKLAELESPSWIRGEFREAPEKHVMVLDVKRQTKEDFFQELGQMTEASKRESILLFVHGFNVSFDDAARRTGQLAYDLAFEGVPMFYAWPSQRSLSVWGYATDANHAQKTMPHLKEFLQDVAARSSAKRIYLIAHSMGNRALTQALSEILPDKKSPLSKCCESIILAAPDVGVETFKRDIAPRLLTSDKHLTLYASSADLALKGSRQYNQEPRLGDISTPPLIMDGMETVDASTVDTSVLGHSYYGDNLSVVSDIYHIIKHGKPASRRLPLEKVETQGGTFFRFRPINR